MNTKLLKQRILDLAIHGRLVPDCNLSQWKTVSLGDVAESISYGVSESAKANGKYKLLRITDIQNNSVNWDDVPYTDFGEKKVKKYLLEKKDILFARTGATVGKSYLVEELFAKVYYKDRYLKIDLSNDDDFVEYAENNSSLEKVLEYIELHYNFVPDKNHLLFFRKIVGNERT